MRGANGPSPVRRTGALLHCCHRFAEIRVLSGVRREWSAEAASIQRFAQVEEGLERRTDRAECAFRVGGGLLAVLETAGM